MAAPPRRSRSPSMGVTSLQASLQPRPDRRDTIPSGGILRVDVGKPRRSSGSSVEFRDLQADPPSPQPSVDRLSVTFAAGAEELGGCGLSVGSDRSDSSVRGVRGLSPFSMETRRLVSQAQPRTESVGDAGGDDDEEQDDYSASVNAIMQRRNSSRRLSKRRSRRASSPFSPAADAESAGRRRSSVFTTSSAETGVSVEEGSGATQEQIFERLRLHKEVLQSARHQPWPMRRKMKLVRQAKGYVRKHEGELQERLAHSRTTRDMAAQANILILKFWRHSRRELANFINYIVPWESRIKEIESHFGSAVASYFTFLRWLFWVNLVITVLLVTFVAVPEVLASDKEDALDDRKSMLPEERANATDLATLWDFEGVLRYSPLFYGYYSDRRQQPSGYRLPFAYFMTSLAVYVYSFVATLRKMAKNSRMSKLSEKADECVFTWKLFTGWDYMIGNAETAHNRTASIVLGFKEALLEEREKVKDARNWKLISLRVLVNFFVLGLLAGSAWAVVEMVRRSEEEVNTWWRENEVSIVLSLITYLFPTLFELLGLLEQYHPRKALRLQLARIMVLNMMNLYALILALFGKITKMTKELQRYTTVAPPTTSPITFMTTQAMNEGIDLTTEMTNTFMAVVNVTAAISSTCHWVNVMVPCSTVGTYFSTNPTPLGEFQSTSAKSFSTVFPTTFVDPVTTTPEPEMPSSLRATTDEELLTMLGMSSTEEPQYGEFISPTPNDTDEYVYPNDDSHIGKREVSAYAASRYTTAEAFTKSEVTTETTEEDASSSTSLESTTESTTQDFESTSTTDDMSSTENMCWDKVLVCPTTTSAEVVEESTTTVVDVTSPSSSTTPELRPLECDDSATQDSSAAGPLASPVDLEERRNLRRLCWETMFGQELVKLTVMDLVMTVATVLLIDFIRAVFVRVMNHCWCWDLEKQFPQYGDFKIAENILQLVHNQGMVWMGMFFSPGLPALNLVKLMVIMYLRSWAVLTCNVPHEVLFRASRSNNFYLALLLTMLFLCVLPVSYAIVRLKPSWHCGPFSGYNHTSDILVESIRSATPVDMHAALEYMASPGIVIPLLVLLMLIIYYLMSLTGALREANADLKVQLRQERTEERRKMFQLVDRRAEGGTGDANDALLSRWRKILPVLPSKPQTLAAAAAALASNNATLLEAKDPSMLNGSAKLAAVISKHKKELPKRRQRRLASEEEDVGTDAEQQESLPEDPAASRAPLRHQTTVTSTTSSARADIPVIMISKTESQDRLLDSPPPPGTEDEPPAVTAEKNQRERQERQHVSDGRRNWQRSQRAAERDQKSQRDVVESKDESGGKRQRDGTTETKYEDEKKEDKRQRDPTPEKKYEDEKKEDERPEKSRGWSRRQDEVDVSVLLESGGQVAEPQQPTSPRHQTDPLPPPPPDLQEQ